VCGEGAEERSEWLGNPAPTDPTNLVEAFLSLQELRTLQVYHGELVNRLGTTTGSIVGATPADGRDAVQVLDCNGAPIVGLSVFSGNAIDAISLFCGMGGFFKGQLLSIARWRENLPQSQLSLAAAQLGQPIWDFTNPSSLESWTVVQALDDANAPYFPQSSPNGSVLFNQSGLVLRLPVAKIVVAQTPTFTFADTTPRTYTPPHGYQTQPPNALGTEACAVVVVCHFMLPALNSRHAGSLSLSLSTPSPRPSDSHFSDFCLEFCIVWLTDRALF
jgi:hypothetical protein